MRFNATLKGIAMAFLAGGMLASCTNDLNEPGYGNNGALPASPVKTPQVIAWSGNYTFGNAVGSINTRAEGDVVTAEMTRARLDRTAEIKFLDEKLPENGDNLTDDMDRDFLFYTGNSDLTFEIYPIYSQTTTPNSLTVFYFQDPSNVKTEVVWATLNPNDLTEWEYNVPVEDSWVDEPGHWSGNGGYYERNENVEYSKGVRITIKAGYYFGFVWNGNYWNVENGTDAGTPTQFYSSAEFNPISYKTNGGGAKLEPEQTEVTHAIMFQDASVSGYNKTYLGFEDWTDFDYQDWVFTCDIALPHVNSSDIIGDEPQTPPTPNGCPGTYDPDHKKCPHPESSHNDQGECSECKDAVQNNPSVDPSDYPCYKEEEVNPDPTDPTDPTDPEDPTDDPVKPGKPNVKGDNEVEINFALNDVHGDYDIQDLVTKLSLHVRYPHDVEVIIPVPEQIYCDQDDLYILKSHNADYTYGGQKNTVSYVIDGHTISLTVEFVTAENDNLTTDITITDKNGETQNYGKGYIRVYTEGINPEVIKYLNENYGDGVNFEVYNYFNRATQYPSEEWPEIDYFDLQYYYLSHSLVNFDWQEDFPDKVYPETYINAFHQVDGQTNPGDCYVWIFGDNRAKVGTNAYNGGVYTDPKGNDRGTLKWNNDTRNDNNIEINNFWNAYQGDHKNGSSTNWIFVNKSVEDSAEPTNNVMPDDGVWPFVNPNRQLVAPY